MKNGKGSNIEGTDWEAIQTATFWDIIKDDVLSSSTITTKEEGKTEDEN